MEVANALNPLEGPFFAQISLCCVCAIVSGFGFFSISMKLKSTTPMAPPALLYYSFAVCNNIANQRSLLKHLLLFEIIKIIFQLIFRLTSESNQKLVNQKSYKTPKHFCNHECSLAIS